MPVQVACMGHRVNVHVAFSQLANILMGNNWHINGQQTVTDFLVPLLVYTMRYCRLADS